MQNHLLLIIPILKSIQYISMKNLKKAFYLFFLRFLKCLWFPVSGRFPKWRKNWTLRCPRNRRVWPTRPCPRAFRSLRSGPNSRPSIVGRPLPNEKPRPKIFPWQQTNAPSVHPKCQLRLRTKMSFTRRKFLASLTPTILRLGPCSSTRKTGSPSPWSPRDVCQVSTLQVIKWVRVILSREKFSLEAFRKLFA